MTPAATCPVCGEIIPADSLDGNCPACLMRLAVADDTAKTAVTPTPESSDASSTTLHVSAPPPSAFAQSPFVPRSLGDYELLEEIARGGMGIVYKARQKSLNRIIALKLLLFGELSSEAFIQRFRVEAQAAASLKHPNIVAVYEIGQEAGQHFFSMEYVEGQNLAQLVREKPLSAKKAAVYVKTIAEAIQSAHEKGILHRDLKPSNVLIDLEDRARVTDFGLAKRLPAKSEIRNQKSQIDLTLTGQVLGTPNYLSPEQALARKEVSAATDVYALGGILYYLLTARPPFQAETLAETLQQVVNAEPVSPRLLNASVPADLETICLKCLEKETGRRYGSARELAEELGRFLKDEPIRARPISRAEKVWRWCRRNPIVAGLTAATALLVLTVAVGSTLAAFNIGRANRQIQSRERTLRRNLYVADMKVAHLALAEGNRGLASELINKYLHPESKEDLRGFEWRYLWSLCQGREQFSLAGHSDRVTALAFSSDSKTLFSGALDYTVRIWNLASRTSVQVPVNVGQIWHIAALSGERVIIGGEGGVVIRSGPSLANEERLPEALGWLALSPDGRTLVTSGTNGGLVWNVADWKLLRRLGASNSGAFSSDGTILALSTDDGVEPDIRFWNIAALRNGGAPEPPRIVLRPMCLALSPDGRTLATAHRELVDNGILVQLWDTATGKALASAPHRRHISGLAFLPDSKVLVISSFAQDLDAWVVSGRTNITHVQSFPGHGNEVWGLAITKDGKTLASGDKDGIVKIWAADVFGERPASEPETGSRSIKSLGFAEKGRVVVTYGDGALAFWDSATWTKLNIQTVDWDARTVAVSPQGGRLAVILTNGAVQLWTASPGQPRPVFIRELSPPSSGKAATQLSWSGDGEYLAVQLDDVHVWNAATAQGVGRVALRSPARAFAVSPRGRMLAVFPQPEPSSSADTAPSSFAIELRDVISGSIIASWNFPHRDGVSDFAFSPDGKLLASACTDNTAALWHVPSGQLKAELRGHTLGVFGVAFSSDGRTLATAGRDASKLWCVESGRELMTLGRQWKGDRILFSDGDQALGVSGSGSIRAVGGSSVVKIWRAPSFEEIAALEQIRQTEQSR